MKAIGWFCVGILAGVSLGLQWRAVDVERTLLQQVRAGDVVLRCAMPNGTRDIDPEVVVDYYEGGWTFANGFSSTCILVVK